MLLLWLMLCYFFFWVILLMYVHVSKCYINIRVIFFLTFVYYCHINICVIILFFLFNGYLLIYFVYWTYRKYQKEKVNSKWDLLFHFVSWYELIIFCNCVLTFMLYVIYLFSLDKHVDSKWYGTKWSDFIDIRSLKKEFRGNWGAILDFPGVSNKNES